MLKDFIYLILLDYGDAFVEIIKNTCNHTQEFNNYVSNYRNQVNSLNYSFILKDESIDDCKGMINCLIKEIEVLEQVDSIMADTLEQNKDEKLAKLPV